ncbi:hypothetical protein L0664_09025 [Octadecabacter sp. G9-8]|uniref:Lipoprotein n=1 Tax=Octadecabacter dasysiphoniae TaxID=2909341 RepID=A0ABS9CVB7_9RHOB|nr:hypothetical protein [Octadecabacter dasysiphoniae]MCF2871208.1 hypothetical protein [Octadecabacter dasysiphoniae]
MQRRAFVLTAPLVLAACAAGQDEILSPQAAIDRVAYVHPGPKRLTLLTMKNTGSDNGAHTGLMINASQRVLWDPAGSFGHSSIPERNDVHFGITPRIEQFYISFHSRITYYTLIQEIDVSPEVAEQAMRLALANGPTPQAACTTHTSRALSQLPGFESVRKTFFPSNLSDQFARLPGVRERIYREEDADDKSIAAAEIDAAITASQ